MVESFAGCNRQSLPFLCNYCLFLSPCSSCKLSTDFSLLKPTSQLEAVCAVGSLFGLTSEKIPAFWGVTVHQPSQVKYIPVWFMVVRQITLDLMCRFALCLFQTAKLIKLLIKYFIWLVERWRVGGHCLWQLIWAVLFSSTISVVYLRICGLRTQVDLV